MAVALGPSPETRAKLEQVKQRIKEGSGKIAAMKEVGIDPTTFYRWSPDSRKPRKTTPSVVVSTHERAKEKDRLRKRRAYKNSKPEAVMVPEIPLSSPRVVLLIGTLDQLMPAIRGVA